MLMSSLRDRSKQAIADIFKTPRFRDERLTIVLLIVALSTVFIFGNDRGHFNRYYDWVTSQSLALAANLSPEHNFLMFHHQTLDGEGIPTYVPYNRFPIGSYILTRLAILPFQSDFDFSVQIYAAKTFTLGFFIGTAVLAYLALSRITDNRWAALAATMLAFSSYQSLFFNDMVGEGVPWLFGIMLVFHGMVIFVQESRFRQLLIKTCIALLLGWHVYALLLVFIILGIANELVRNRSNIVSDPSRMIQLKATSMMLMRSRYLMLGIVALICGISLLAFNFTNEYLSLNRETPLTQLPSFQSTLERTGIRGDEADWLSNYELSWWREFGRQLYRIGGVSIPYYLPGYENTLIQEPGQNPTLHGVVIGSIVFIASLMGLFFTRHKMLMATLALFYLPWSVVMRYTAGHDFEAMFLIGIPLVLFSTYLIKFASKRFIIIIALSTLVIFVMSASQISFIGNDDEERARYVTEITNDFDAISEIVSDSKIYIDVWELDREFAGERYATHFYLAGNIIVFESQVHLREFADFVITRERVQGSSLLTPENHHLFLYKREALDRLPPTFYEMTQFSEPVVRSEFDVHLIRGALIYVKEECTLENTNPKFFLHIFPLDPVDLPEERKQSRFNNLDFRFDKYGGRFDGKCAARIRLPEYRIASIRTGQFESGKGELWSSSYDFP